MKQVLTIAGSDSGGGAGIQADIKAISANGAYAMSVVTAVTAQNTVEVTRAFDLPTEMIVAQLDAIYDDFAPDAVKTGMLSSPDIVEAVASSLCERRVANLVVDPVMVSKSGFHLLREDAIKAVTASLLPLARAITPNAYETRLLAKMDAHTADDAKEAARRLADFGSDCVIVKGGHLDGETRAVDVLYDGRDFYEYASDRIETTSTHGAGCAFSAALATFFAQGIEPPEAVAAAKKYIDGAIRNAPRIGHGHGPMNHFWRRA